MERYDVLPRRLEHTIHCPPRDATEGGSAGRQTNGAGEGDHHHPYPTVTCIATSAQYLATGTADGRVIIWPVSRRTPVDSIDVCSTSQSVADLSWSPDGCFLFAVLPVEGGVVLRAWKVRSYGNSDIASEIGSVQMDATGAVKFGGVVCQGVTEAPADRTPRKTPKKRGRKETTSLKSLKSPITSTTAQGMCGKAAESNGDTARCPLGALVTDVAGGGLHWLSIKQTGGTYALALSPVTLHDWDRPQQVAAGDRVSLFWKEEVPPTWFAGTVAQVDPLGRRILVFYDDGQVLWEDLEGPERMEWKKIDAPALIHHESSDRLDQAARSEHAEQPAKPGTEETSTRTDAMTLAVLCGESFDHLAVLDGPTTRLRIYERQGPDGFRIVDEMITNDGGNVPSHLAVSPDGLHLAVTHPHGNVFAYSVTSGNGTPPPRSPRGRQPGSSNRLRVVGHLHWDSWKGKQGAKSGERLHTWHCCTFAPDSRHIFCSMTLDHDPKRHPIVIWDHLGSTSKRILESSTNGVPHVVTSLCAHPARRPMELFALSSSGLVVIWASRLVQNWSVIDQGFESFEQNRSHIEQEDDFDVVPEAPVTGVVAPEQDDSLEID